MKQSNVISKSRDISLDWIGGLLVVHMVLYHISQWARVDYVIENVLFFFMPWFFFKAGMFHIVKPQKIILKGSYKRLIVPFLVFSLIGQLILSIYNLIKEDFDPIHFFSFLKTLFLQGSVNGNLALWFLLSLFCCRLLFNWFTLKSIPVWFLIAFFYLSSFLVYYGTSYFFIPYYIGNVCYGMTFYCLGYQFKNVKFGLRGLTVLGLLIFLFSYFSPSIVDARSNTLLQGAYIMATPYSLVAILFINNLFQLIPNKILKTLPMDKIGSESMSYYVTHWIILIICDIVCLEVLNIKGGYSYWGVMIISCLLTLPLVNTICTKHFPRYIGKV